MQTCGRSRYSTFVAGEDSLEILHILRLHRTTIHDIAGKRRRAQAVELTLKLLMFTVIEESQRTSSTGSVVNHLGYHRAVLFKEQFVTDTDLACRLYQHIPQAKLLVQLTQQEHFYLCVCFLLGTIEACRKHFCVVEDKSVAFVEVVHQVAERQELVGIVAVRIFPVHLNSLALAVNHHQARLVTIIDTLLSAVFIFEQTMGRIKCQLFFRQFESEL